MSNTDVDKIVDYLNNANRDPKFRWRKEGFLISSNISFRNSNELDLHMSETYEPSVWPYIEIGFNNTLLTGEIFFKPLIKAINDKSNNNFEMYISFTN